MVIVDFFYLFFCQEGFYEQNQHLFIARWFRQKKKKTTKNTFHMTFGRNLSWGSVELFHMQGEAVLYARRDQFVLENGL